MSYLSLLRNAEAKGRVKLQGGQSQGYVECTNEKITVEKYAPKIGKGSEYAAKYRAEDDRAYYEEVASMKQTTARQDVTGGDCDSPSQMEQPEELTTIGTMSNLRDLNQDLTQVYQNYSFEQREPSEHLEPIFNEKEQILRLIETNQVCIIKGPTGCGKSTQIPQFILDSYAKRRVHCNIVVTQPRRIAAISIAQRVCEERGWGDPGHIVGYQVALDRHVSEDTRLLYCTTGVLLEKLITAKDLNAFTHIILDEVHEREEDMDLTMLIVKRFLRLNSPNVKVVLMSATMDVSRFAKYFEVCLPNAKQPAPSYEIKRESKFSVQVHYLDALNQLGNLPEPKAEEPGISNEAFALVPLMIQAFNMIDAEDFRCKRSVEQKGAVLIFLPGLHQIETLHEILMKEDQKQKQDLNNPNVFNFWLCPLHSSITKDEQEKVRSVAPRDMRKIILSTNIAESSITIPDVKYVIDFCLTKHLVADPVTGFTSLQMAWASHTNCIQREGRVGRVQDGRVYRMVRKNFYQFKMAKESVPEMQRCPLEIVVLKCKRLMDDYCPLRLISNALDPPDLDNYEKTILKLKEIGALLTTCKGEHDPLDGDLTFMGRVMAGLPLDIRISKLILLGHVFDVLEEAIIMGCAMSVRNIFSEPFQRRLDAYHNKLLWADTSESDAIAYLNAYNVWRQLTGLGKFSGPRSNEQSWARTFMLQIKHLREVALQEQEIKRRLKSFNIQIIRQRNKPLWNPMQKPLILKIVIAGAFYPHYYSCSAQNPNAETEAIKMLGGSDPNRCVYLQNMPSPAPLYFDQVRECLHVNKISDNVEFHFDGSQKLIVEFNQNMAGESENVETGVRNLNAEIPGEILMPVYRAIKMRQLNTPIPIKIYSPHVATEKLKALKNPARSTLSLSGLQLSEHRTEISFGTQAIEVAISHVENAGHFYGHLCPIDENLRRIHTFLNNHNLLCEVSGEIEDSVVYAAPYKDEEEQAAFYYRARIIKRVYNQNKPTQYVDVFFIDYGNSIKNIAVHELREIVNEEVQKELDKIPPLALEFVLTEVAPSDWSSQSGRWSKEANAFVTKILMNPHRNTWMADIYSYVNGVASVYLILKENLMPSEEYLRPSGKRTDETLNDELIKRGYAKYKEESYFSKINHAKREEVQNKKYASMYTMDEDGVSKNLIKIDLETLPFTSGPHVVNLKGPHSPLEMKLFSKAKCSTQKEVRVEWNSVNSVLLDSDPRDPHERLVVAGFVSQSPDGRKLSLNHTTVLPNMHGLAALLCLIFAPTIELRTDDARSRYTGALCGLGMEDSGASMFPENDMEIKFDVEFSDADLINVNKLRYWMNERLCGLESEDMPDSQIIEMHKHIRNLVLELLTPVRRSIKVYYNSNPYLWNQVNKIYLRHPFPECDDFSERIYQLHFGIEIDPKNDRRYIEELVKKLGTLHKAFESGLMPRQMFCDLCDLDFAYCKQLKMHMMSTHHLQLVEWLNSRANAHGISLKASPASSESSKPSSSRPTRMDRPANSRF